MSNDQVLKAIREERKRLKQRLAVLDEMERRAREAPVPNGYTGSRPHAPSGALREAILAALKDEGSMYGIDIKKKVVADGWRLPINGQVFTRNLRMLVDGKVLNKVENGSFSLYSLRRRT